MTKTKRTKIISGIFAFLPLLLFLLAIIMAIIFVAIGVDMSESSTAYLACLTIGGFSGALTLVMVIIFAVDACRNKNTDKRKKVLLLLMLYLGNILTVPIYWRLCVYPAKDDQDQDD